MALFIVWHHLPDVGKVILKNPPKRVIFSVESEPLKNFAFKGFVSLNSFTSFVFYIDGSA